MQPPRYGIGPLPNQSMTTIPSAMGQPGAYVPGPSRIDPNQIPRPGSSVSPVVFETRHSNQANPPPVCMPDQILIRRCSLYVGFVALLYLPPEILFYFLKPATSDYIV